MHFGLQLYFLRINIDAHILIYRNVSIKRPGRLLNFLNF